MEKVKKEFTYMSRDSRFIVEVLGIIVLADFGIAGKYTEQSEYFYGTAYYKAPEIFDETAKIVDDRSDVWSTGIVMLEKMYGLDKERFPKPKSDSEREEWYANWQKEVRRKVEGKSSPYIIFLYYYKYYITYKKISL
ncbi:hypothetical protein FOXB_05892 [Fusarium oxysporum f. sp. conglutinans Fo5176]|uniref:mitogen-activated protein kinase kinase n=1 Tax=Fusarium oxysporum (strain Fo5176) TaxID=660025 RepID=F9FHL3_FUSOF|nr:hypothetical protein FOXB_05892 [Fusarium oxysporum f. sp. conglutinans Fo5176]